MTYPATSQAIRTGCGISSIDARALPLGSAAVYLVASAANDVTTIDDRFCFGSIAGWTLTPKPASISGGKTISVLVEDGGDKVNLPYVGVTASVNITKKTDPSFNVTLDDPLALGAGVYRTDTNGYISSVITVSGTATKDDAATITYYSGDGETTVSLKIP